MSDKIRSWIFGGSIPDALSQLLYVMLRNSFWVCQNTCHQDRNCYLKNNEISQMIESPSKRENDRLLLWAHSSEWLTSVIFKLGSGEMTVLPVNSTRFPDRFPRKRPCFPFRRWTKPRFFESVTPGASLFMYSATCACRTAQQSWKKD